MLTLEQVTVTVQKSGLTTNGSYVNLMSWLLYLSIAGSVYGVS